MKRYLCGVAIVVGLAVMLAACASQGASGGIVVQDAWVRAIGGMGMETPETAATEEVSHPMEMGMNSAAYMVIRNNSSEMDRLLRVDSDVAAAVELHKSEMQNEVMTMRPVENIEIAAGGEARLEPGGLHVMLIGVKDSLEPGQQVALTLVFENAGSVAVQAQVRAP